MEAINSRERFDTLEIIIIVQQVPIVESIDDIFRKFNFGNESGLLQYWACTPSNSEDIGCNLMLKDQPFRLTLDYEGHLQEYRRKCLENHYPIVGIETSVGNWLAGRAAQTKIADHWTIHHVANQEDRHSANVGGKGQLVLPVVCYQGGQNKLVGVIEFVTPVPKESYVQDFEQIHNLLKEEGLKSTYMGKIIKVKCVNDLIRFALPLSAEFTDLRREVTMRQTELQHKNFRVEYSDIDGNRLPISGDEDLRVCMAESSSKGAKFIKMFVLLNT
ncbi:hypothetical protein M8C21_033252 [Ambrosia artemisiifolia]|uniref:PB1 domain-containing protein n=1 Tax=Ambrosia artemisiifolia TaxID=4212 RepID=A0AAD5D3X7_AMBAR|nr:hypothetical protein M8C21_033252 [Ambrosia artemisiifolia]